MSGAGLNSLSDVIDEVNASGKTLLLVNLTGVEATPLAAILEKALSDQSVAVAERHVPDGPRNLVCLVDDGGCVATTPLRRLKQAYLLINADRYRTSTKQIQTGSFPDVLTNLDDIEFVVRGFPQSNDEKLLLVLISRFVEFQALSCGAGELHAFVQSLSRLDDEFGTREIYDRLGDTDVSTHIHGIPDTPTVVDDLSATVHTGTDPEVRRTWLVSFTPPDAADSDDAEGPVALVAEELDANVWRGMWTYNADRVDRIQTYIRRNF